MSLISCPECAKQVSSTAESCPHCGAPIAASAEVIASSARLRTVQQTSKRLKLHLVASSVLTLSALLWLFIVVGGRGGSTMVAYEMILPPLLIAIGLFWHLVTKVRIWWHHK